MSIDQDAKQYGIFPPSFIHLFIGGGNGNLLQYSCLRNNMERILVDYSPWGGKRVRRDLAAVAINPISPSSLRDPLLQLYIMPGTGNCFFHLPLDVMRVLYYP